MRDVFFLSSNQVLIRTVFLALANPLCRDSHLGQNYSRHLLLLTPTAAHPPQHFNRRRVLLSSDRHRLRISHHLHL